MTPREAELLKDMKAAQEDYHNARRDLSEFAALYDREMVRRAEHVATLHRQYKAAWYSWREEKQRAFIAELEAVAIGEEAQE